MSCVQPPGSARILTTLRTGPLTPPEIAARTGIALWWVMASLRWLEFSGQVESWRAAESDARVLGALRGSGFRSWRAYAIKEATVKEDRLLHTDIYSILDAWAVRTMVATLLPHIKWRRHGIGALQGYVHEAPDRELRVHIWSPALVIPGIIESGNAHNHRFSMLSRVLVGSIKHTEWQIENGEGFALYDFVHARLHNDQNRADMARLPVEVAVRKVAVSIQAGAEYTFKRGAYHDSQPETDIVVTLVEKFEQVEERARVIAPADKPPVPAFSAPEPAPELVAALVEEARSQLLAWPVGNTAPMGAGSRASDG